MGVTRLWFVRHGEVAAPYVGTFLGAHDVPLSDVGRHQGAAVAAYLKDAEVDAILTSPLQRARETAAPLGEALGLDVEVRPVFREMHFGAWEGKRWEEIEAMDPAFAAHWQTDPTTIPCPDGEAAGAFAERVQEGLQDLREEFNGRQVALFAHAGVNRAVLADILHIPYMESFAFSQDYGCVNAAGWDTATGFGQIVLVNMVPGPRSVDQGDGRRNVDAA